VPIRGADQEFERPWCSIPCWWQDRHFLVIRCLGNHPFSGRVVESKIPPVANISSSNVTPRHNAYFEKRSSYPMDRRAKLATGTDSLAIGFVACRTALEDHRLGLEERKQTFGSTLASYT